jgi:hypothetical protein
LSIDGFLVTLAVVVAVADAVCCGVAFLCVDELDDVDDVVPRDAAADAAGVDKSSADAAPPLVCSRVVDVLVVAGDRYSPCDTASSPKST